MRHLSKWTALVGVAVVSACASDKTDQPIATQSAAIANRNLDVLFMVDNSSSMRLSQNNLLNNFPTFITALQSGAQGLPNIHIAVVSSDMGAGDGNIAGCDSTGGNNGIFQYTNRAPAGVDCTANALKQGQTFISNVGGQANYTGDLSSVFTCIAALGETGCGFEHQFASVLRALGADGAPAPQENQGFLRSDALLAIVMITNEDDCSARSGVMLYDTTSNQTLASTLGPPANFRCNEFGHRCDGGPPPRMAPNNDVTAKVDLQNCTAAECAGSLVPVGEFVARIGALKTAPASEILVAAIAGAPTPYQVHWKNPSTNDTSCGAALCPWPEITHSCTASDGSFADPGVRINQMVGAFGTNGYLGSICNTSFAPTLQTIATRIGQLLDAGGGTGGGQGPIPNCTTTGFGGNGGSVGSGSGGSSAGSGGNAGTSGTGGTSGGGNATGTDGSADGPMIHIGGGGCQLGGGVATNAAGLALAVMVLLARRRRGHAPGRPRRR